MEISADYNDGSEPARSGEKETDGPGYLKVKLLDIDWSVRSVVSRDETTYFKDVPT